jgi:hypothetical protein
VIRKLYGYHQVKFPMPLRGTAWAIMAERNAAPIAKREKKDLEDMYARAFRTEGIEYRAFPRSFVNSQDAKGGLLGDSEKRQESRVTDRGR